jgi:hypothetical protein
VSPINSLWRETRRKKSRKDTDTGKWRTTPKRKPRRREGWGTWAHPPGLRRRRSATESCLSSRRGDDMVADSPMPSSQQRGHDGKISRQYGMGQTVYDSPSISRSHLGPVRSLVTAAYVGVVGLSSSRD